MNECVHARSRLPRESQRDPLTRAQKTDKPPRPTETRTRQRDETRAPCTHARSACLGVSRRVCTASITFSFFRYWQRSDYILSDWQANLGIDRPHAVLFAVIQNSKSMEKMDTENESSQSTTKDFTMSVIQGHIAVQTKDSLWLCIKDVYGKLHRPNTYDIGGSYINKVPDFWFTFKTEKQCELFILHLFAGNHMEGYHCIGVSSNALEFTDRDQTVYLAGDKEIYKFTCKENNQSYITTFTFKETDVELILKGKNLYIGVELNVSDKTKMYEELKVAKMNHDYAELLSDPVGSDFIIESADGEKFPIHKTVLSLRSDVFKAMLEKDMAESKNGYVKLIDVDSNDLKNILEYVYTGTIKDIEKISFHNIIMLADRFNILGLRKLCDYVLIDQLSPTNALDILILADRFNSNNVKTVALQFIKQYKDQFKKLQGLNLDMIDNKALLTELCAVLLT